MEMVEVLLKENADVTLQEEVCILCAMCLDNAVGWLDVFWFVLICMLLATSLAHHTSN